MIIQCVATVLHKEEKEMDGWADNNNEIVLFDVIDQR
jgi:hypothetical protein